MTTILLLLSLLLHVVAFYFIIVLYSKYSSMKDLTDSHRKLIEETEDSMTSFLIEMKDENERLIQHIQLQHNSFDQQEEPKNVERIKKQQNQSIEQNHDKKANQDTLVIQNDSTLPDHLSGLDNVVDIVEISQSSPQKVLPFEIEALSLHDNGYTVEQIAKKFKKGKTEIELLLKFRQN